MSKGGFAVEYILLDASTIRFSGHPHRLTFKNWWTTEQIVEVRNWCYDTAHSRYQWHSLGTVDFKNEHDAFACMLRWRNVEVEVKR